MARTTRSSAAQQDKTSSDNEKQATSSSPPSTRKQPVKKRKRVSDIEHEDQPATKLARADEEDPTVRDGAPASLVQPPPAGDLHLPQDDANKILDILEMIDTQGLLDRVFPLHNDILNPTSSSSASSSKIPSDSFSLRNLLKEPQAHPLRVLRSAIIQLFPISSHPRSKTSVPAAQQQRFCELALLLLEQASTHTLASFNLTPELIIPDHQDTKATESSSSKAVNTRQRKYALVQRLPSGDWWTSSSADVPGSDSKALKDLRTAHAELVSVLPSISTPDASVPTLGEFYTGKRMPGKAKLPGPRYVSCGAFLDYGPYASFAPSFDSEGAEAGRTSLEEVYWRKHEKGKMKQKAKALVGRIHMLSTETDMDVDEADSVQKMHVVADVPQLPESQTQHRDEDEPLPQSVPIDPALLEIDEAKKAVTTLSLPEDETKALQIMLDNLGREGAISDLLGKNAKALQRLEALQHERLGGEKGSSSTVSAESEEWKTAHSIMDSLTLLASMRPRSSTDPSNPAIVPSSPVLRALHDTVFTHPTQGWYGTLAENRALSLRDDSTVHIRTTAVQPVQPPATPAKPATLPSYSTPSTTHAQQNFSYSGYPQQFRGAYPYAQGQASSYYGNSYAQSSSVSTPTPTTPYSSTTQSQYPYSNWYSNYPQTATPGPSAAPNTLTPVAGGATNYASYSTPGSSRVIANTVASGRAQPNGWAKSAGYAPTLPAHLQLRPGGAGTYAPSTPTPLSATPTAPASSAVGGFVNGYQPTSSTVS